MTNKLFDHCWKHFSHITPEVSAEKRKDFAIFWFNIGIIEAVIDMARSKGDIALVTELKKALKDSLEDPVLLDRAGKGNA